MRFTETVILLTPTTDGVDSTNEPTPGPDLETPLTCTVWPASGKEDLEVGTLGTIDEWVVLFPAGVTVGADARARIRGHVFHATVDAFDWGHPNIPGSTVTMRRVGTGG